MGWRGKMGGAVAIEHSGTSEQKEQKEQKGVGGGAFATIATIAPTVEKLRSDPEREYARAERQAIIDADGGQDNQIPYTGPVDVVMDSAILEGVVDVILEPDQTTVDGVRYTNDELKDLLSRRLNRDEIRNAHEVKRAFGGVVIEHGDQS